MSRYNWFDLVTVWELWKDGRKVASLKRKKTPKERAKILSEKLAKLNWGTLGFLSRHT